MTVQNAIEKADRLRPNSVLHSDKEQWLFDMENRIYNEVYSRHRGDEREFTDLEHFSDISVLFLKSPYDEIYVHYLCANIDYINAEYDRYNNDSIMVQSLYGDYQKHYNSLYAGIPDTLITG